MVVLRSHAALNLYPSVLMHALKLHSTGGDTFEVGDLDSPESRWLLNAL